MSKSISAEQALQMFEDGTGLSWKVIKPSQAKHYSSQHGTYVWTLCLDNNCKRMLYVVPENAQPTFSDYEKIIAYLKKNALPLLPKIKLDLNSLPEQNYFTVIRNLVIKGKIKFKGDVILKYKKSLNPISYSPSRIASLKSSVPTMLDEYLTGWNKVSISMPSDSGKLNLKISNSVTNEAYDLDVTLNGNKFIATVTPKPISSAIGNTWEIEGQISLEVSGEVYPSGDMPVTSTPQVSQVTVQKHKNYVLYILVGVGAVALGLATAGVGDAVAAVVAGGVGGATALSS